ncbi:MAG: pyrroloquinoline quinone biosynthesis protein PqqC, partial [Nitrososphaerales archaeon]
MQSLVERINREVEERSLLKHPFYEMWSRGQLSLDDLSGYSKEY